MLLLLMLVVFGTFLAVFAFGVWEEITYETRHKSQAFDKTTGERFLSHLKPYKGRYDD